MGLKCQERHPQIEGSSSIDEGSPRIGVCCLCQDTLSFVFIGRVLPHGSFIEGLVGDFRKEIDDTY